MNRIFIYVFFCLFVWCNFAYATTPMPQFDSSTFPEQLFWLAISFGILFCVMWKIALPLVVDTLVTREKKIAEDLKKAELLHEEAISMKKKMEKKLVDSKKMAHNMFIKVHEELSLEETQRIRALQEILDTRVQDMQKRFSLNEQVCREKLPVIVTELTNQILLKLFDHTSKNVESSVQEILKMKES